MRPCRDEGESGEARKGGRGGQGEEREKRGVWWGKTGTGLFLDMMNLKCLLGIQTAMPSRPQATKSRE